LTPAQILLEEKAGGADYDEEEENTVQDDEIGRYMKLKKEDAFTDPLSWWASEVGSSFPLLKSLARRFLAIPATSVASERVFSTAGNVITKKRARLNPKTAEMQVVLHENRRYLNQI